MAERVAALRDANLDAISSILREPLSPVNSQAAEFLDGCAPLLLA